jgi:hypothetical protein
MPCIYFTETVLAISGETLQDFYKTALGPQGQVETSLKIEDLRTNKTIGKLPYALFPVQQNDQITK